MQLTRSKNSQQCVYQGCDNKIVDCRDLRFHSFPIDPKRWEEWERKCGRAGTLDIKHPVVCANHFQRRYYVKGDKKKGRLLSNAVPKDYRNVKDERKRSVLRDEMHNKRGREHRISDFRFRPSLLGMASSSPLHTKDFKSPTSPRSRKGSRTTKSLVPNNENISSPLLPPATARSEDETTPKRPKIDNRRDSSISIGHVPKSPQKWRHLKDQRPTIQGQLSEKKKFAHNLETTPPKYSKKIDDTSKEQARLDEKSWIIFKLKSELKKEKIENKNIRAALNSAQEKFTQMEKEKDETILALKEDIVELEDLFKLINNQLHTEQAKNEHLESLRKEETNSTEAALATELSKDLNDAREIISSMEKLIEEKNEDMRKTEGLLVTLHAENNTLISKLSDYESIQMRTDINKLESEIERLQQVHIDMSTQEKKSRFLVKTLKKRIRILQEKYEKKKKLQISNENKIRDQENFIKEVEEGINAVMNRHVEYLSTTIKECESYEFRNKFGSLGESTSIHCPE